MCEILPVWSTGPALNRSGRKIAMPRLEAFGENSPWRLPWFSKQAGGLFYIAPSGGVTLRKLWECRHIEAQQPIGAQEVVNGK